MPEITRFYGIIIKIFFRGEHNPPHIHAVYGEHNGMIEISSLEMIEGDLPPKALSLVKEWAEKNIEELQAMWDSKTLKRLPPLE